MRLGNRLWARDVSFFSHGLTRIKRGTKFRFFMVPTVSVETQSVTLQRSGTLEPP